MTRVIAAELRDLPEPVALSLSGFVETAHQVFGDDLKSVVLYGRAARAISRGGGGSRGPPALLRGDAGRAGSQARRAAERSSRKFRRDAGRARLEPGALPHQ